ncbi:MAG: hypothetical protein QOG00_1372, partial [Pyrinomonadaceae bacterium]|nr:hypothetical protein [Pyrinomonadaceae bacterium]
LRKVSSLKVKIVDGLINKEQLYI